MAGKEEHDALRAKNASQLSDIVKGIENRFSCPVFALGDMNCNRQHRVFKDVYEKAGFCHFYDLAEKKDDICTIHGNPVADENGFYHGKPSVKDMNSSIDHIIGTHGGYKVLQYRLVTEQYALDATDHYPVYADIEINVE